MMNLVPRIEGDRTIRVLCLGAHSDDIEIGCGGAMLKFVGSSRPLDVRWVVFSGNHTRAKEAKDSAGYWLEPVDQHEIELHDFKDGFFPDEWAGIKNAFEKIKGSFEPDLIFTHNSSDLHQDHRIINELTWNTFRNHMILEYEIPKYDGDLRTPNFYVPLSEEHAKAKAAAMIRFFNSQGTKHWFCEELFLGLMRIRGMESCAPSRYAEGFHARKVIFCL